MKRLRVLFIAGLTPLPDGSMGGQVSEAMTLWNSPLASAVELRALSSTSRTVPPPPMYVRLADASKRLLHFVRTLFSVDAVLIFTSNGPSLLEKGLMAILARIAGRGVALRVMSGLIPEECNANPLMNAWMRIVLRSAHVVGSAGTFWTGWFGGFAEAKGKLADMPNPILLQKSKVSGSKRGNRISYVGWMHREKGIFDALEIIQGVLPEYPDATLTMAGGGRDLKEFQTTVQEKGLEKRVRILGWISRVEVQRLLDDSDIFLFPSHFECMPNAVLEAMGSGLPVVSTNVGAVPDVIKTGENGFLLSVGDVQGMTKAILHLLSSPAQASQMGARARATIEQQNDIHLVWRKYAEAIRRAASAAGRKGVVILTDVPAAELRLASMK